MKSSFFPSHCRASIGLPRLVGVAVPKPVERRARPTICLIIAMALLGTGLMTSSAQPADINTPPLMKDFIGINGDVFFKGEMLLPICKVYRMYEPAIWDLDKDTSVLPPFPMTKNGVNWGDFYGKLKSQGYTIVTSIQIDQIKANEWKDMEKDSYEYGKAWAKYFGPSGHNLVDAVEIGNEPAEYSDKDYRKIFESMGRGLRDGDPKLKILTAAAAPDVPDQFTKSVKSFQGLEQYYDVLNIHTYAFTELWPSWKRSFPEDPKAKEYLKVVKDMLRFRDQKAPGKEIWVTEFGYDASTNPGDGKFTVVTDTEQAQWLARSILNFSSMGIQRAYIFFYNDKNENSFHCSAGIMRNLEPKESFYALAHLYKSLADYRFSRAVTKEPNLYVFEYINPAKPKEPLWVAWSPTGTQKSSTENIPVPGKVVKAERMPLKEGDAEQVPVKVIGGSVEVPITESPVYLWLNVQ